MARPYKSDAEHALHGTSPHPTTVRNSSDIPEGRPRFGKVPEAERPTFKRICRMLRQRRHLTDADAEIIRLYCSAEAQFTRAKEALTVEGEICAYTRLDSNGQPHEMFKENLWLKVYEKSFANMMLCLDRLGLTPAAKDRIKPAKPPEAPKVDELDVLNQSLRPQVVPFPVIEDFDEGPEEPAQESPDEAND